jgi:hypothetical protein
MRARDTDRRERGAGRRAAVQAVSRRKRRGPDSGGCRREWPSDVVAAHQYMRSERRHNAHARDSVGVGHRWEGGLTCGARMQMGAHELTGSGTSEHVREGTG